MDQTLYRVTLANEQRTEYKLGDPWPDSDPKLKGKYQICMILFSPEVEGGEVEAEDEHGRTRKDAQGQTIMEMIDSEPAYFEVWAEAVGYQDPPPDLPTFFFRHYLDSPKETETWVLPWSEAFQMMLERQGINPDQQAVASAVAPHPPQARPAPALAAQPAAG